LDIIFYGLCETIFFTKRYFKRFELETPDLNIGTANLLCCMNPQLSQDLIPVVYHDFELLASIVNKKGDRQMMVQMPLKNLTLEQLQQLKVHLGLVISTRGVSLSVHSRYCYHSVNIVAFGLAQNDHTRRLLLHDIFVFLFFVYIFFSDLSPV